MIDPRTALAEDVTERRSFDPVEGPGALFLKGSPVLSKRRKGNGGMIVLRLDAGVAVLAEFTVKLLVPRCL
jgi:hypothetical protein